VSKHKLSFLILVFRSTCFCGSVSFEVHGDPLDAKHCHCRQCQKLHGAPFQWAVIFPKTSVRLVKNENDSLHFFSTGIKTRDSMHHVPCKVSCDTCRSSLFDEGRNTVLAYPSAFNFEGGKVPLDFQPTCHIFYAQRVMEIPDGIPKWEGHKGTSKLMQELSNDEGTLPKYKGYIKSPSPGELSDADEQDTGAEHDGDERAPKRSRRE